MPPPAPVSPLSLVGEGWGEGLPSIDRPKPLTRIASDDAIRPLPQGERWHRSLELKDSKLTSTLGLEMAAGKHLPDQPADIAEQHRHHIDPRCHQYDRRA